MVSKGPDSTGNGTTSIKGVSEKVKLGQWKTPYQVTSSDGKKRSGPAWQAFRPIDVEFYVNRYTKSR